MIPTEGITTRDILPADIANTSLGCGPPLNVAQLQAGKIVLDLGSDGGLDCLLAAQRVGVQGRVMDVDMMPALITLARVNAQKVGATNVEFRQGELENLPLDDASVIETMRAVGFVPVQKVAGSANALEMVYSAKFVAYKPRPTSGV